ncbi:MAG: glycosyltransferase family 4 protein [Thiocapsa sp.]|uniref:glycosyltransferase family 4 protein n=1 Tax=Thiocapsa sp. TaxID=2024551 RepID=UPI001BD044C6|nr:glycosyltransferase family 4 protein [Thiocapsa sp.]QVL49733.1 MAG: glycosyltransferase family 4 protein [Thiocapsa sp.]
MVRVAYVCADPGVPVFGAKGSSIHVQEVVRALRRAGADVALFATRLGGEPPADLCGISVHPLPALPPGEPVVRERAALSANRALRAALAARGPFDLIYERYALWSHAGMDYARAVGAPGLLEVNAPLIEEQARHRTLVHRDAAEQVAARVFAAAHALVAVSTGVAAYLATRPGLETRVHVIPNGVDPARFPAARFAHRPASRKDGSFTVGFVGTLKPWHGLDVLVDAFARLHARDPDCRLLIVGEGPERRRIEAAIAARRIGFAVRLTGAVAPNQVPDHLAAMDVGLAPYPELPDFYFSPLKVYEYMAAALPVVASRIGDLDQIVQPEVTGLLCPPDDPAAVAAALARLRDDAPLRRCLGDAARARVLSGHCWDAVVARILGLAGHGSSRVSDRSERLP